MIKTILATIYHNPRCSKSRQTYEILKQAGADITEIRYLETPPSVAELDSLCHLMQVEPTDIIRQGEALFKELGLSVKDSRSREEWLKLMIENPRLIERPIVKIGQQVVMGRPPENVSDLLASLKKS